MTHPAGKIYFSAVRYVPSLEYPKEPRYSFAFEADDVNELPESLRCNMQGPVRVTLGQSGSGYDFLFLGPERFINIEELQGKESLRLSIQDRDHYRKGLQFLLDNSLDTSEFAREKLNIWLA